jgi:hypothetical protein
MVFKQGGGIGSDPEVNSLTSSESVTVTDGEATNTLHYGSNQDRINAGNSGTALGIGARATRDRVSALGAGCAQNNTATNLTASGFQSAQSNAGNTVTTSGVRSAQNNAGDKLTASGVKSARENTGFEVTASGVDSAQNNTGDRVTVYGVKAASGDGLSNPATMGDDNIGIGVNAIRNNQASGLVAIGQDAGVNAQTDDQLIITDRNGNRRMVMDLTNGNLKIDGSLTQNATL